MGVIAGFYLPDDFLEKSIKFEAPKPVVTEFPAHLTMFYFGEDDDGLLFDVNQCVNEALSDNEINYVKSLSFHGSITGYARFRGDEMNRDPVVALVNMPDLHHLRRYLGMHLEFYGIPFDDRFIPHITFGYVPRNKPLTLEKVKLAPVHFDTLSVASSTTRIDYKVAD